MVLGFPEPGMIDSNCMQLSSFMTTQSSERLFGAPRSCLVWVTRSRGDTLHIVSHHAQLECHNSKFYKGLRVSLVSI